MSPIFLPPFDDIPQESQADSIGALRQSPEVRIPDALVHLRHRLFLIARLPDARAADHKLARRLVCSRGGLCGRLCAAVQGMSVSTRRSKPCGETHESKCLASQGAVWACAEVVLCSHAPGMSIFLPLSLLSLYICREREIRCSLALSLSPALSPETLRRPSSVAAGRFREVCFGAIAEFRPQANKGKPFASAKLLRHHPIRLHQVLLQV